MAVNRSSPNEQSQLRDEHVIGFEAHSTSRLWNSGRVVVSHRRSSLGFVLHLGLRADEEMRGYVGGSWRNRVKEVPSCFDLFRTE